MSRTRSALTGVIAFVVAVMTAAAVTVPAAPAAAAPPPPVFNGVTQAWDAVLNDYVWRVTLGVEFQTAADTTTVFAEDATGATLSETFDYTPSFLATVSIPDSWVLPFTFRQNDGTGPSASLTPTIQLNSYPATLVNPPWRVVSGTYVANIDTVPPGVTVHVSDSAGWSLDVSNSTTSIQNLQFDMPATIVEPVTAWSTFGVTNSSTQPFPVRVPTTPSVTSVTGTGPWTISGTGISGHQIIVQTVGTPTVTRNATIVGGTWTVSMPNTATAPIRVYQRTLTGTTVYSDPVMLASLPGTAAMSVAATVSTAGLSSPPQAGDLLTYSFTATNTGGSSLTGVTITPVLPGISALTYSWPGTAGSLAAGQFVTATATYAVTQADVDAGVVAGSVSASSTEATATAQNFSTPLTRAPALSTVASVDDSGLSSPPQPGDVLTYTVTMTNTGNVTLTGVGAAATPPGVGPFTYTWPGTAGVLAPGQSVTATAPCAVTAGDVTSGSIAATFTGSGQPPAGAPVTSAASTVTTGLAIDPPVISAVTGPDATGWDVAGTGEPGATVTLTPATGAPITAPVQPDGTWTVTVPLTSTGPVSAVQSLGVLVSPPDTAPLPGLPAVTVDPVGVPDASGWDVEGTGVPGATVTVTPASGPPVTATVQPDGAWSAAVPLSATGPVAVTQAFGPVVSAPVSATLPAIPPTPEPTVDSVTGPDVSGWDIEGTGVPGATITITDQGGTPVTATVQPDGSWSAALPLTTDGPVEVTQTVGASTSDPVPAALPGLAAPVIDTVSVPDASGWDIAGTGVPGATLTVTPTSGAPVSTTVQPDGSWAVALPLTAVGPISATQAFGPVVSDPDTAPLPGLPAVTVDPVGVPDASGWDVEGTGVPGATVTVTPATGSPVTAIVQPDGTWSAAVPLSATGPVDVAQAFGPVASAPVSATLPAIPPTPEPTVDSVTGPDASGWDIEGSGEPGATITISDQAGTPVTTTVQPDGTWSAALPLSTDGPVEVTQTVGASTSDPVPATLPELAAPTVTDVLGPDAIGWDVYGTGVPGATIAVTDQVGTPVSTTVLPDGTWVVAVPLTATGPLAAVQSFGPVTSDPVPVTLPALAAPVIDTVSVPDASGWDVEGTGVPGAALTVTPSSGSPVSTTVQPNGSWAVTLPLTATGPIAATQAFAPVVSDPDFATLPGLPAVVVDPVGVPDASGWEVEGTGVPGATVTVTPATGSSVTATVQPDGTWSAAVPLSATGPVQVTQAVGPLTSAPVSASLPAIPPTPEPTVDSVTGPDASGWDIEGTGEPGATVTITDQDGTPVTTTVQPDGTWSAELPLTTEGPVEVTQTVGASTSDPVPATLPELAPPTVDPVTVPDASGWDVEGTGVPGATVTITDAGGTPITTTVQPDGSWSAVLPPTTLGPVEVTQAFGAVASDPVTVALPAAPDPVAVTTVLGPDAAGGWLVGGTGEDGATVTVTDDAGATVAVPVTGGTWSAVLPSGTQGPLAVTQTVGPVTSAPLVVTLPVSELTVAASVDAAGLSATPQPGEPLVFQFTLVNAGDTTLSGVAVSSSIPGLAPTYSWPGAAGVLAPGQTATATATYALTQSDIDARAVASTVTASGQNPAGGAVSAAPATTSTPIVAAAALEVSATSDVSGLSSPPQIGELVAFTFDVANTGSTTLTSVQLASTLPGMSALSYAWPGAAGVLAPGEHATVTATYPLALADVQAFAVVAAHDVTATALSPDTATVTSPTVTVQTPLGAPPEPFVTVLYGPDESGEWTIGGEGIDGAEIVITDGNGVVTTTPVVDGEWSTTLPPGTVAPLTINQRLGSVPSVDVGILVLPTTAGDLDVAIDDSDLSPVPAVGEELALTFVVTNSGLVPLTGVNVSTTVPGLGPVTLTGWPGAPGTLAPGESVTAVVDYSLTQDDLDAGRVVGTASLTGAGPAGNAVVTPTAPILHTLATAASAAMMVEGRIEGVLAPLAPGVTVDAASDVHWTVTVTNTGPVTLHNVAGDSDAAHAASAVVGAEPAAALIAPQGFSGSLAPGASVTLSGTTPATVGTHGILASITARVGTMLVAGNPVTLAGEATMFYTAAAPVAPPGGSSGPGGLALTGLEISVLVALALGLAALGTSGVLVGAARRRSRR